MEKQIGKITLIAVLILMAMFVVHSCRRNMARPEIELSWRGFFHELVTSEYGRAYQCNKQNHTLADFTQKWLNYDLQHLVTSNRDSTVM